MTDAQREFHIKLESIFLPYSRRRRDEFYKIKTGAEAFARFVHYTSADAALKIIEHKKLWMRNTTCMVDYREVRHGFDILNRFFLDKEKRAKFDAALDLYAPGIANDAINIFNQWWQNIQLNTFVTSISEHDDKEDINGRLSMWRGFGGNSARVALILRVPWRTEAAEALCLTFSPVAYFTESESQALLGEVIENIKKEINHLKTINRQTIVDYVFTMFISGVTCSKHEGFSEEREWRAIYSPAMRASPLMESSVEVISGIPQTVYKLPLDGKISPHLADLDLARCFDRLIIGPTQFAAAMGEAFVRKLKNAGVPDAEQRVVASNIPIRT